jgi:hypothetical protein
MGFSLWLSVWFMGRDSSGQSKLAVQHEKLAARFLPEPATQGALVESPTAASYTYRAYPIWGRSPQIWITKGTSFTIHHFSDPSRRTKDVSPIHQLFLQRSMEAGWNISTRNYSEFADMFSSSGAPWRGCFLEPEMRKLAM